MLRFHDTAQASSWNLEAGGRIYSKDTFSDVSTENFRALWRIIDSEDEIEPVRCIFPYLFSFP